jgi:hypothetical protein
VRNFSEEAVRHFENGKDAMKASAKFALRSSQPLASKC